MNLNFKKLKPKQIAGLAALTVGALVLGKIARDIKKVCQMANEKEAELALANEQVEEPVVEVIEETPVAEAIEEPAAEVVETEVVATETIAD